MSMREKEKNSIDIPISLQCCRERRPVLACFTTSLPLYSKLLEDQRCQSKQGHKALHHFHVAILYYLHEYPGLVSAISPRQSPPPEKIIRFTDIKEHTI